MHSLANQTFAAELIQWQKKFGRHHLPWQKDRDPYKIWLAEVMLQQTQAAAVAPYFSRFLRRLPTLKKLADAREETIMQLWSGLGYYARARNLHRASKIIMREFGGEMPKRFIDLIKLPGVGRSTAAAISVFADGEKQAILDGNAKRVFARFFAVDSPLGNAATLNQLWRIAEVNLPTRGIRPYTQGLMDLGAMICIRANPLCGICPLTNQCKAKIQGRQNELPIKNRAKAKPIRRAIMPLILIGEAKRILLIKRPSRGIWGGLRSLPEFDSAKELKAKCESQFGIKLAPMKIELPKITHHFTHFSLVIESPVFYSAHSSAKINARNSARLFSPNQIKSAALPAPIKKMLAEIAKRKIIC